MCVVSIIGVRCHIPTGVHSIYLIWCRVRVCEAPLNNCCTSHSCTGTLFPAQVTSAFPAGTHASAPRPISQRLMIASLWRKFAVPTFPSSLIFIVNRNQRVCAILWRKNWSLVDGTQFVWAWLNYCTDDLRQDVEMVWVHRARTFLSYCAIFRATC